MAPRQVQRLEAAERKAQHVNFVQAQHPHGGCRVIGHVFDTLARATFRRGDPSAVEENDLAAIGESIGQQGVPMVHAAAEVL
jgi:hypothetical protein